LGIRWAETQAGAMEKSNKHADMDRKRLVLARKGILTLFLLVYS
jgi:hypothetical protein